MPSDSLLNAYLHSLTLTNPALAVDSATKTVYTRQQPIQTHVVSVLSGSTLAATPSTASFVGPGVLSASINSTQGYSDRIENVRKAIQQRVNTSKGVLVIVPQSGDDELIIGAAVQKAKTLDPSLRIETLVASDTFNLAPEPAATSRLGAGLPLLLKICGAVAAMGYDLNEVTTVGRLVVRNLISVGSVLRKSYVQSALTSFGAADVDVKEADLRNADDFAMLEFHSPLLIRHMMRKMLHPKHREESYVHVNSNEVVLHVSGHGSLTMLEMGAITSETVKQLEQEWNIRPVRIYTESIVNRHGRDFAISILNVCNTDIGGPSMIQLLDAPAEAVGWNQCVKGESWQADYGQARGEVTTSVKPSGLKCDPDWIVGRLEAALTDVIASVRGQDWSVGDVLTGYWVNGHEHPEMVGTDYGKNLWECARDGLQDLLCSMTPPSDDIVILLNDIASRFAPQRNNPAGAMCTIFLIALTQSFQEQSETATEITTGVWVYALEHALEVLTQYTHSRSGIEPLLSALNAFVRTFHSTGNLKYAAAQAVENGQTANDRGTHILCMFLESLAFGSRQSDTKTSSDKPLAVSATEQGAALATNALTTETAPESSSQPSHPHGGSIGTTACITCKRRRKSCDNQYPQCDNCVRDSLLCEGNSRREGDTASDAQATRLGGTPETAEVAQPQHQREPGSLDSGVVTPTEATSDVAKPDTTSNLEQASDAVEQLPSETRHTTSAGSNVPMWVPPKITRQDANTAPKTIVSRKEGPWPLYYVAEDEDQSLIALLRQQVSTLRLEADAKKDNASEDLPKADEDVPSKTTADEEDYVLV